MNPPILKVESPELDLTPEASRARVEVATAPGRRELSGRLAGLSLPQQVVMLALWPFLEQLLAFSVGFVDTVLAGHLGTAAADAVGTATYVGWLVGLVQASVAIGVTAIVARATGGRHRRLANSALGQGLVLALWAGLGIGLAIFLLAPLIAHLTGLRGDSARYCIAYLRILACAAPFSALLAVGAAALRGAGDTRTPFLVLIVVNLVNAGLSVLLVAGPPPVGGRGVTGIALGTFAGWLVGAVLMVTVLFHGWGSLKLRLIRLRPNLHTMLRIARLGLPNLGEALLGMWIANFLVLMMVGSLGISGAMGAHVIAIRIEAISFLPGFALGITAATLAGQYLGLGDPARARQAIVLCWRLGAGVMVGLGLLFVAFPHALVSITTDEPVLREMAAPLLRMAGLVQGFFGTAIILGQGMRGAGDTRTTMLLTAASTYGVRLPLAYLCSVHLGWGLKGVWVALCAELTFRGCIFAARFHHGGWTRVKV